MGEGAEPAAVALAQRRCWGTTAGLEHSATVAITGRFAVSDERW